jgi:hypothetical protein
MKLKTIRSGILAAAVGLALVIPSVTQAGGNQGQMIAKFEPLKSPKEVDQLQPGNTVVKVCRACSQVMLVRVVKGGKGFYDYEARKCEDCGSEDTYLARTNQEIPFKERVKR